MRVVMGFLVASRGTPLGVADSFEDAKRTAAPYIEAKASVQIQRYCAAGPSRIWRYDYGLADWVEDATGTAG
jgi:hypothetical protein